MKEIKFYSFSKKNFFSSLIRLLEKILEKNLKITIVAKDDTQRVTVNEQLWTSSQQSFIAHGSWEDPVELREVHPIWISCDTQFFNNSKALVFLSNDLLPLEKINDFDHVIYVFEEEEQTLVKNINYLEKEYEKMGCIIKKWSLK
jgi:DNA polymerase-3 subunit chi